MERVPKASLATKKSANVATPMRAPKTSKGYPLYWHAITYVSHKKRRQCIVLATMDAVRSMVKHKCLWHFMIAQGMRDTERDVHNKCNRLSKLDNLTTQPPLLLQKGGTFSLICILSFFANVKVIEIEIEKN